jgi:hypothetical protein
MNTHGHADVAETAGLPLLEKAFGQKRRSLRAFHVGNWLTDVSQAVDPVAYASGSGKLKEGIKDAIDVLKKAVDRMMDELIATIVDPFGIGGPASGALKSLKPDLAPHAKRAVARIQEEIDLLVMAQSGERDSKLAQFLRAAFLVIGYFKFVHPDSPKGGARMNFECFMRVFGRPTDTRGAEGTNSATDRPGAYTQYYPHEHLDRPEVLPSRKPPVFAPGPQLPGPEFAVARGKQAGTRSPRGKIRIEPDLYSYLRDDLEMTAGLLAEVDLALQRTFAEGIRDDDPEWHITLAKLGHALHQVEDFFAHSNWVELAAKRLGQRFLGTVIPPTLPINILNRAQTTFRKRLKRHLTTPLGQWKDHPDEDWVTTGYFDFQDTLLSLLHITEELWGGDVSDPYAAGYEKFHEAKKAVREPQTVVFEAQRFMREALDVLTQPERAFDDRDNEVAKKLKSKFGKKVNAIRRPGVTRELADQLANEAPLFQQAPPEIRHALLVVLIEGSRAYTIGKSTYSIYQILRDVRQFIANPFAWLLEFLPEKIAERAKKALVFYAKDRVYEWLGAGRIGCHSLLAKDHGQEPFYEHQKNCAIAVHWYIVTKLLRWATATSSQEAAYIDWLELLEFFLRNPLPPTESSREVRGFVRGTIVHVVERDEQLRARNPKYSLEARFRRTAFEPARFTWRTIADANFATASLSERDAQRVVNHTLRDNAWGYPVTGPNYAFKAGLPLLIPDQKIPAIFRLPAAEDAPPWFTELLEKKDWKVFTGYEDPASNVSQPPLTPHTPVRISHDDLLKIISTGRKRRTAARDAYRPGATTPPM